MTTFGARARAAVDDEETALAVGISVPRLRLTVFTLGGMLAGLSGALGAGFIGARPGIDIEVFLLALVIVVAALDLWAAPFWQRSWSVSPILSARCCGPKHRTSCCSRRWPPF
jgi:hypothetical protein